MTSALLVPAQVDLGPLAPHNIAEVIAGLLLAGILGLIFAKFISPRFEAAYEQRREEIEGGILRAERAQAEAAAAKAEYTQQLAAAREEAARVREEAKNQGAAILAQMRTEASKESDRLLEQTRARIAAERDSVTNELRAEIGGLATTLAGRIVGESLDDDARAQRAVERFLADLEAMPAKSAPQNAELS